MALPLHRRSPFNLFPATWFFLLLFSPLLDVFSPPLPPPPLQLPTPPWGQSCSSTMHLLWHVEALPVSIPFIPSYCARLGFFSFRSPLYRRRADRASFKAFRTPTSQLYRFTFCRVEKKNDTLRFLFFSSRPHESATQPRNDCVCNQSRYFSRLSLVFFFWCHFCLKLSFTSSVRFLKRHSRAQSRLIMHILFMVTCMKLFIFLSLFSVILVFRMCIIY